MDSDHTIIIGGGVVGLSIARALACRGAAVTVLDARSPRQSASQGNAGQIAAGHKPIPHPDLQRRRLKLLLNPSGPLYIPPRPSPSLARWLMRFSGACTQRHFKKSMDLLAMMGLPAVALIEQIIEEDSIDCQWRRSGLADVYHTPHGRRNAIETADMLAGYGYEFEHLDGDALRQREPLMQDRVLGAVIAADSGAMDPAAFLDGIRCGAASAGATIIEDAAVTSLDPDTPRTVTTADGRVIEGTRLVLAAGVWTTPLAASLGIPLPMQPGKGYHIHVTPTCGVPSLTGVLHEPYIAFTPMGETLRLAGTLEFSGINHRLVERRLKLLARGAARSIRGLDHSAVSNAWCGLRPCTSDGLPIVGKVPGHDSVWIATGHAMLGVTLGPLTGHLLAQQMLDGTSSIDLEMMRVGRRL
jgi:D-amino-acid dehydrogenase